MIKGFVNCKDGMKVTGSANKATFTKSNGKEFGTLKLIGDAAKKFENGLDFVTGIALTKEDGEFVAIDIA